MRAHALGWMAAALVAAAAAAALAVGGARGAGAPNGGAPAAGGSAPAAAGGGASAAGDPAPAGGAPGSGGRITQREPIPARAWVRQAGGPVARLVLSDGAMEPARLEADRGERVRILVLNHGQHPHNVIIPDYRISSQLLAPGAENYVEFTADRKGDFAIYSDGGRPGRPEPGLLAVLRVRQAHHGPGGRRAD